MEKYNKINDQCLAHLKGIHDALTNIETKGDSTIIMYKIRLTLDAVLQQIDKDNQEAEEDSDSTDKE